MPIIAVAGATGRLGHLIVRALLDRGATVRALIRPSTTPDKRMGLSSADITEIDYADPASLQQALAGADGVVSALNGLRDIIVGTQTALLDAAVAAQVARFIPSDYAADLTKLEPGENRNFDLRREFRARLLDAPIASTSILVGGFMELLLRGRLLDAQARQVNYWGDPGQPLNYTTTPDTAQIAATAALDPDAPPILRIVGDTVTATDLAAIAGELAGTPFSLNRLGTIDELAAVIQQERTTHPEAEYETFPRFQQLQYTHNMQSGRGVLSPLDNARYGLKLTSVRDLLTANAAQLRAS
jgi:uncharacterized protein YbjT (DUF2867 family)